MQTPPLPLTATNTGGRLYNFMPHGLTLMVGESVLRYPSDGAVRLASGNVEAWDDNDRRALTLGGHAIPTVSPQECSGFDGTSRQLLAQVNPGDAIVVSMVVAQWLQKHGKKHGWDPGDEGDLFKKGIRVYALATGPLHAVRDPQGQLIGTRALEFYCNLERL